MSHTLFISDLHLESSSPATIRALGDFLQRNRDCDALYILGDLFEAWIGDDDDSPLAGEIAAMLTAFTAAGPALYLMVGNRDFLLGEAFCQRVGGTLLPDPSVVDLYGTPTLLMHGDSLCTRDQAYLAFRQTTRGHEWQSDFLSRSLEERRAIAADLRSKSREATSSKAEDIMDVTPEEVTREMSEHAVARLVHGHTHRPACHDEPRGKRWVLGDWGREGWVLRVTPDEIKLDNFVI